MHEKQLYGRGRGGFHRIVYTEWGQASAQPPVICVHGLTRNGRDFDFLARALEGNGRQVFCPDIVGAALDLSPHWEPQALVTLGYPADGGKPFSRRPLDDVVRFVSGA